MNGTNQHLRFTGTKFPQVFVPVGGFQGIFFRGLFLGLLCGCQAVVMSFKIALWSGERGYKFSMETDDKLPTSPFTTRILHT